MKKHKKPDWKIWINNKKECGFWLRTYLKNKVLRKSIDESKLYMQKADHNLNFANWIIEKHKDSIPEFFGKETFYDWTISMYYYAVYHAALALVCRNGYKSKGHSATLCFLIHYHYHLQESIDKDDVELIATSLNRKDFEVISFSKELREKASYNVHESFEKGLARQSKEKAIDFVNKIKELLNL